MQPPVSASLRTGIFALLALGSLGLKAAVGPPRGSLADRDPGRFDQLVLSTLHAQHFSTGVRTFAHRSDLILAERGDCRIAVRDAKWGNAIESVFAEDVEAIGPVRYLYRGNEYSRPPALTVRLGRLQYETRARLGMPSAPPFLIAVAASPACGDSRFGLADLRGGA
jgi:hypothetical protein